MQSIVKQNCGAAFHSNVTTNKNHFQAGSIISESFAPVMLSPGMLKGIRLTRIDHPAALKIAVQNAPIRPVLLVRYPPIVAHSEHKTVPMIGTIKHDTTKMMKTRFYIHSTQLL
jgi:hypothetical protein